MLISHRSDVWKPTRTNLPYTGPAPARGALLRQHPRLVVPLLHATTRASLHPPNALPINELRRLSNNRVLRRTLSVLDQYNWRRRARRDRRAAVVLQR